MTNSSRIVAVSLHTYDDVEQCSLTRLLLKQQMAYLTALCNS